MTETLMECLRCERQKDWEIKTQEELSDGASITKRLRNQQALHSLNGSARPPSLSLVTHRYHFPIASASTILLLISLSLVQKLWADSIIIRSKNWGSIMNLQECGPSAPALNSLVCIHAKQHQEPHRDPQSHNTHLAVRPAVDLHGAISSQTRRPNPKTN